MIRAPQLVSATLLVFAAIAIWLALPRFLAGVNSAPHSATMASLVTATPASEAALARAHSAKVRALGWHLNPRDNADIGALHLRRGEQALERRELQAARALFVASIDRHRIALRQAPLQPYVWTRLAQAEIRLDAPVRIIAAHLRQAIATAPWESALIVPRIGLAFAVWTQLDDATRGMFEPQIRHAARLFPSALARQAQRSFALDVVLTMLAGDAELLRRFSEAYSQL